MAKHRKYKKAWWAMISRDSNFHFPENYISAAASRFINWDAKVQALLVMVPRFQPEDLLRNHESLLQVPSIRQNQYSWPNRPKIAILSLIELVECQVYFGLREILRVLELEAIQLQFSGPI
jgi:hypothetical protein